MLGKNIVVVIDWYRIQKYKARFYLEPRSLFIFTEEHYHKHFHGIEEAIEDIIVNPLNLSEEVMQHRINNLE